MQDLLRSCGYNPAAAELLQREGMGPHELKARLRFVPGEPGSLEWTHGYKKQWADENPIDRNAKIALGVAAVGGIAAALYYFTRPAAAATISTPVAANNGPPPPSTTTGGGGGTPTPPVTRTGTTTTAQTYTVTDANAGSTTNMNIGDTLLIVLPINDSNNTTGYITTDENSLFTAGTQYTLSDQVSQAFVATVSGSGSLVAQGEGASGASGKSTRSS